MLTSGLFESFQDSAYINKHQKARGNSTLFDNDYPVLTCEQLTSTCLSLRAVAAGSGAWEPEINK